LSPPMYRPSTTLPELSFTLSADSAAPAPSTSSSRDAIQAAARVFIWGSVGSLDDRQGGRDLQVDDQLQLVLDLQEPQARARRQRGGGPLGVPRLPRIGAALPGEGEG